MQFIKEKNYQDMSQRAADIMLDCLKAKPDALFCIATGASPTEAYRLFAEKVKAQRISTEKMRIIQLDEWCGLDRDNPATCAYYIKKHILEPLDIPKDRYMGFCGMNPDGAGECAKIAGYLEESGGIDLCILGIGRNGHLGLNEPAEELNPYVHQVQLQAITQTHAMLAKNNAVASQGYTIGIKDILASKGVLLLITGGDKKEAYGALQKDIISSQHPANYLKLHNNAVCVVDMQAVE